jgi:hypothetical protein
MPTKLVIDCSTGTQTEVELTAEEVAELQARQAAYLIEKAEQDALLEEKAAAKASAEAKLAALGLTAEEIAAL